MWSDSWPENPRVIPKVALWVLGGVVLLVALMVTAGIFFGGF